MDQRKYFVANQTLANEIFMSGKFRKWKHTLMCLGSKQAAKWLLIDMFFILVRYIHA